MIEIFEITAEGKELIEDLYWFEENYVHSFEDGDFEIYVNGVLVYSSCDL
jgi:hypothetical protein